MNETPEIREQPDLRHTHTHPDLKKMVGHYYVAPPTPWICPYICSYILLPFQHLPMAGGHPVRPEHVHQV